MSGTYIENINLAGKGIVVGSRYLVGEDTTFITNTLIDGNENGTVITFESGEDSSSQLVGLTITNGNANKDGEVYIISGKQLHH